MSYLHFNSLQAVAFILVIVSANAYPSENSTPGYVPHEIYPFNDGYGPRESHQLQPVYHPQDENNGYSVSESLSSLLSKAEMAVRLGSAFRSILTVGGYIVAGVGVLLLSGLFTIAVCSTTSLCTIKFRGVDQETIRSFSSTLTPEKLTRAAVLVEDAIGKYKRMQSAVNN